MTEETEKRPYTTQREVAALFLLLLVAGGMAAAVTWGRLGAGEAAAERVAQPAPVSEFLPAEGGRWTARPDRAQRECLMRLFFDTIAALKEGQDPPGVPDCVEGGDAPVFVTAFAPGGASARQKAREGSISRSVQAAARLLFEAAGPGLAPDSLRVRVDILTDVRPMPPLKRIAFAEQKLDRPFGLAVEGEEGRAYVLPADLPVVSQGGHGELLRVAGSRAGLGADAWRRGTVPVWRLEADGFINDAPGSRRTLPSPRGLVPIGSAELPHLLRATSLAADYLSGTLDESGSFLVFRDCAAGLSGGCRSLVQESDAAAALSALAELRPGEQLLETCHTALSYAIHFTDVDERDPRLAFASRSEVCPDGWETEKTAQLLEGLCRYRAASGHAEVDPWIRSTAEFLLFMQDDDGVFQLRYDPETGERSTPREGHNRVVAQSRCALALALAYRELERAEYLRGARQALAPLLESGHEYSAAEARWVLSALLELSAFLPDERYLQWADRIAAHRRREQLTEKSAPAEDLVGATLEDVPSLTALTADDLVVFAAACLMGLAEQNEAAADRAARYVMRLQVLPENAYYLAEVGKCLGGIRERPGTNLVRLPTMTSALRGLVLLTEHRLRSRADD